MNAVNEWEINTKNIIPLYSIYSTSKTSNKYNNNNTTTI